MIAQGAYKLTLFCLHFNLTNEIARPGTLEAATGTEPKKAGIPTIVTAGVSVVQVTISGHMALRDWEGGRLCGPLVGRSVGRRAGLLVVRLIHPKVGRIETKEQKERSCPNTDQ